MKNDSLSPDNKNHKGRRSGAERRLKYFAPYMKFVFNGDEKRSEDERRSGADRRKEPRTRNS